MCPLIVFACVLLNAHEKKKARKSLLLTARNCFCSSPVSSCVDPKLWSHHNNTRLVFVVVVMSLSIHPLVTLLSIDIPLSSLHVCPPRSSLLCAFLRLCKERQERPPYTHTHNNNTFIASSSLLLTHITVLHSNTHLTRIHRYNKHAGSEADCGCTPGEAPSLGCRLFCPSHGHIWG